jgi:hypothetical protein
MLFVFYAVEKLLLTCIICCSGRLEWNNLKLFVPVRIVIIIYLHLPLPLNDFTVLKKGRERHQRVFYLRDYVPYTLDF